MEKSLPILGHSEDEECVQILGHSEDVMTEILSRLPVKSLLKFKCVSKSWYHLISSQQFIQTHLKKSTNNKSFCRHKIITTVRSQNWGVEQYSFRSVQCENLTYSSHFDPRLHKSRGFFLFGSCNGLIPIILDRKHMFLWNPATRESKRLADPGIKRGLSHIRKCGFGFDEISNDYKVFIILSRNSGDTGKVYSLNTDSWKVVHIRGCEIFTSGAIGKFANGRLHWIEKSDVLTFDIRHESFATFKLPFNVGADFVPQLGDLNGRLCLLCHSRTTHTFDAWVWNEYGVQDSWTKLFTNCNPCVEDKISPHPLFILPTADTILFIRELSIASYNVFTKSWFWHPRHVDGDRVGAECFVQSLVSLSGNSRKFAPLD